MDTMISATEVQRRAGCTYRQLDVWIRLDVVVPEVAARGSGSRRRFTEAQVPVVRMVADLAALGARAGVLRRAAAWAQLLELDEWHGIAYVDDDGFVSMAPPGGSCWAIDLEACRSSSSLIAA